MLIKLLHTSGGIAIEGECCNGQDAVQLIRASRPDVAQPDVALLDISMPVLDGIEVAKAVRNLLFTVLAIKQWQTISISA